MSLYGVFFVLLVATFLKNGSCDATTEATLLALEASGQLLAPKPLIQKRAKELEAIRAAYPAVSNIAYSPPWSPGVLLAQLSDVQLEQIRSQYGEVTSTPLFGDYKKLTFTTQYNPVVLANELTTKKLVESAEPDNIIGGGNGIQYNSGTYTFSLGWGDCPSGCINNHYWEFNVIRYSIVTLIREYGTPLGAGEAS